MPVFVALIRAVNVGGVTLPMAPLRTACEDAGLKQVSTYVASGNLVFESGDDAQKTKALLTGLLSQKFGLTKNQAILRTADDLATAIAENPFRDAAAERPKMLHVSFLEHAADAGAAEKLAAYKGPERIKLAGDRIYLDYVEGAGRSKLTPALLDRALKTPHTARNWNTVLKLLEMARALE